MKIGKETAQMTHLEIIEIRTTGKNHDALEAYLANWQAEVLTVENAPQVNIYRHTALDSDFSIHLLYDAETEQAAVQALSERLASDLKEFGLVNQTVWVEHRYTKK